MADRCSRGHGKATYQSQEFGRFIWTKTLSRWWKWCARMRVEVERKDPKQTRENEPKEACGSENSSPLQSKFDHLGHERNSTIKACRLRNFSQSYFVVIHQQTRQEIAWAGQLTYYYLFPAW